MLFLATMLDKLNFHFSYPDIIAGGLNANLNYSPEYQSLLPHFWNQISVCIKHPEPLAHWRFMFFIFSDDILWLIAVSDVVIILCIIYLMTGFEKNPMDIYTASLFIVAVMTNVSMPINKYVGRDASKFLASIGLIVAFLLIAVYNALFYNVIMITRYPHDAKVLNDVFLQKIRMVTTYDIAVRLFTIYFIGNYFFISNFQESLFWMKDLTTVNDTQTALDLILNEQFAALASQSEIMFFSEPKSIKCFDKIQVFAVYPIAMFARKDMKLISSLQKIIQSAIEAGLIDFWRGCLVKSKICKDTDNPVGPIQINHFGFLLGMMAFMMLLSCVFFIGEIIIFQNARSSGRRNLWTRLDRIIDGKRRAFFVNNV